MRFEVLTGGVAEDSSLLTRDVTSLGECFLAFKRITVPSSSRPSILLGLPDYRHTAENIEITQQETAFSSDINNQERKLMCC